MNGLDLSSKEIMSSLEISELTGKRHDHVKTDIEKTLKELGLDSPSFRDVSKNHQNQTVEIFNLPHRECDILMMGYSVVMRAKVYDRWLELENANTPKTFSEALLLAGKIQAEKEALEYQAKIDAPLVKFANQVIVENNQINVGTYAKALSKEFGVKIGPNKLMDYLRKQKYLMKGRDNHEKNYPYQKYIDAKWFGIKVVNTGVGKVFTTQVTGKGQAKLAEEIIDFFGG